MYVFSKWISEFSYKRLLNSFLLNNNRIVVVCLFKFTASPIVLLACIEVLINWIANTHFIKVWNKNILKSGSEISNIRKQNIQSNLNPTSSSFCFVSQTYFYPSKLQIQIPNSSKLWWGSILCVWWRIAMLLKKPNVFFSFINASTSCKLFWWYW